MNKIIQLYTVAVVVRQSTRLILECVNIMHPLILCFIFFFIILIEYDLKLILSNKESLVFSEHIDVFRYILKYTGDRI